MTRPMMTRRVAYFAFDRGDAATRRRVEALRADGVAVDGFAMRRRDDEQPDWVVADLGRTRDNAYLQRLGAIALGVQRALARRDLLVEADVLLARNLDMLAIASLVRIVGRIRAPLVYECLDIHRLMVREDAVGRALRAAEGWMLRRSSMLWVSSPAFLTAYFDRWNLRPAATAMVENRMTPTRGLAPRPAESQQRAAGPLRIGWFGNLRCRRSLALLERVAATYPGKVEIHLRGYPALGEIPDFEDRVAAQPGFHYGGRYRAPEDLGALYEGVDVVWAGDFMDDGFNSAWLLPNRLYEGGWFACPPIAPAKAETGRWIAARNIGFPLDEPLEEKLPELVGGLLVDPSPISKARSALLDLPAETFVQPRGAIAALIEEAIDDGRRNAASSRSERRSRVKNMAYMSSGTGAGATADVDDVNRDENAQ